MLIEGQWWLGLGRNGQVQHGFPHRHFDHFVHPPYHIHGIRSIDLCPLDGVINAPIVYYHQPMSPYEYSTHPLPISVPY